MKRKALLMIMVLVLSGLLMSCGGQSADPSNRGNAEGTTRTAAEDTASDPAEATAEGTTRAAAEDTASDPAETTAETTTNVSAEGNTEVTTKAVAEVTTDDSAKDPAEGASAEKWSVTGTLLRCEQGDMIYIPNQGPVIMENLSAEQKGLIESLVTGDVIRVTIEVILESYPGHCSPETVEFTEHGDLGSAMQTIDNLREMGWMIKLPVPSLEEVADSKLTPLEEKLHYFTIDELRTAWGEPKSTMAPADLGWSVDTWQTGSSDDTLQVDVQYDNDGNIIGGYTYRAADTPTIW